MAADKYPEPYLAAYDAALVAGKAEKEAFQEAEAAAKAAGYELTRFGWVKQFQSPKMKSVSGVKVFAAGTWTDSAGQAKTYTNEDLDKMVEAFTAGVPSVVPAKCGHTSDAFNQRIAKALEVPVEVITGDKGHGQIKLGSMSSLQRKGDLLIAAFDKVPEAIANLIEGGQYATVSCEIEDTVGDFGPVITGVALLGAEEPAVDKATLERALVFGGSRKGARVYSFTVGDDIPTVKGKLKAAFASIGELIERLVGNGSAHTGDEDPAALQKGKPPKDWWDRCTSKVSGWPGVNDVDAFCGDVWFHDNPIPASSFASDEAANQAEVKFKEGGNTMKLPKSLEGKKPAEIRAMKIPDLVKTFTAGETPTVEDLKGFFQEGDLAAVAAALGLKEGATIEDILAAIKALVEGAAAAPGEAMTELKKATDRIAELEKKVNGQTALAAWKEKTSTFSAIPGTAHEHAVRLADIEAKAGKDAADAAFKALEEANRLAVEATHSLGTSRKGDPTDFDKEVAAYQKANPTASKADAIKAVSKARPDLYFSRK
jgi:hypothetical protein